MWPSLAMLCKSTPKRGIMAEKAQKKSSGHWEKKDFSAAPDREGADGSGANRARQGADGNREILGREGACGSGESLAREGADGNREILGREGTDGSGANRARQGACCSGADRDCEAASPPRPQRASLPDFCGRALTLPHGPEAWLRRGQGPDALVLGLGPGSPWLTGLLEQAGRVCWLEHEPTLRALPPLNSRAGGGMPQHWQRVSPEEAVALAARSTCYFYGPGMRLAPDFWGPLLGRVDAALLQAPLLSSARELRAAEGAGPEVAPKVAPEVAPEVAPKVAPEVVEGAEPEALSEAVSAAVSAAVSEAACGAACGKLGGGPVLLPGHNGLLLHQELHQALEACGLGPVLPMPEKIHNPGAVEDVSQIFQLFKKGRPRLLLSVNLRGLDAEGRVFHLCRALGVPVALWLVDNPWHLLSALRLPWWREALIFVTDASFVPELTGAGAQQVYHLPLAVARHMWRNAEPENIRSAPEQGPLFVGRSAFPQKERFFAAARVPEELAEESSRLLERSRGPADAPNYFWWQKRLGAAGWPGMASRNAGLGAEICAQANRARWLRMILEQANRGADRIGNSSGHPGDLGRSGALPDAPGHLGDTGHSDLPGHLVRLGDSDMPDHSGGLGDTGHSNHTGHPPLRIVGDAGWHALLPGAQIFPPVDYYTALPDLYASAGVVLNITSLLLPQSLSQRHFDVWATGGTLFSDATPGMDIFPASLTEPICLYGPEDFWPRWDEARSHPSQMADLRRAWREHLRAAHGYEHRVRRICEVAGIGCVATGEEGVGCLAGA